MLGVEALCFFTAEMQHLQGHNLETSLFKTRKDFTNVILAHGIRFNDGQRLFYSHARLQSCSTINFGPRAQYGDKPREIEKSANYTRIKGFFIRENPVKSGLSGLCEKAQI